MSRAPRPAGVMPASSSACQQAGGLLAPGRGARRRPRRCSRCPRPSREPRRTRTGATANRSTAAASGCTVASSARASGPCTARTTRSAVTSSIAHSPAPWNSAASPSASTSGAVFDALGITRKSPGADPPHDDVVDDVGVVGVEQVRVLRPAGTDAAEVVGERPLQRGERSGAAHVHRAEVRHVEHDGALAARAVLLEHARCTGSACPSRRTAPCARRARGAARRAATGSRRLQAARVTRSPRRDRSPAGAPGTGRASPRRCRRRAGTGGSRPYFTSRCR